MPDPPRWVALQGAAPARAWSSGSVRLGRPSCDYLIACMPYQAYSSTSGAGLVRRPILVGRESRKTEFVGVDHRCQPIREPDDLPLAWSAGATGD